MVRLNNCLNKEFKLYGFSVIGIGFGFLGFLIGAVIFSMLVGIMTTAIFFTIGCKITEMIHKGYLQKILYIYLPRFGFLSKNCPPSYARYLI
jgi:hypothetical protein